MRGRFAKALVIGTLAASMVSACALQRAKIAERAKTDMIGLTKSDVLACMGQPDSRRGGEDFQEWVYSHSDAPGVGDYVNDRGGIDSGTGIGNETRTTVRGRYCVATVSFRRDSVASVRFSGTTGGIVTRDEQCAFLVSACTRPAQR
jgi:hypothetical protein